MNKKHPISAATYLLIALACVCLFAFAGLSGSTHQNFATEAWEVGRFFELWWLWISLPGCCATAVLAAMRGGQRVRMLGSALALGSAVFVCLLG